MSSMRLHRDDSSCSNSILLVCVNVIPDAWPQNCFWHVYTGTSKNGTAFGLQMSQAGFSSHNLEVSLHSSSTSSTQLKSSVNVQNNTHCLHFWRIITPFHNLPSITFRSPLRCLLCGPRGLGQPDLGAPDRRDRSFSTSAMHWWVIRHHLFPMETY